METAIPQRRMSHWHLKASSQYFSSTRYLEEMDRVDWRGSSPEIRRVSGSFLKAARSAHWPFLPVDVQKNAVRFVHAFRPSYEFSKEEIRAVEALLENLDSDLPEFIWFSRSFVLVTDKGEPDGGEGSFTISRLLG